VCWIVDALAESQAGDYGESKPSTALSPFFMHLVTLLLQCGARPDADEKNLRASSYNALSTLISKAGEDCRPQMEVVLKEICDRLEQSFNPSPIPANVLQEVQGSLIGCAQVLTNRLQGGVLPIAERLMTLYVKMFATYQQTQGQPCVHEETVLATGALAIAIGDKFEVFMAQVMPILRVGIQRHEELTVCGICIATVGDLGRSLNKKMLPYCDDLLTVMYTLVNDTGVNRKLKPGIIQCFGDIALATEGAFDRYIPHVVPVLQQASMAQLEPGSSPEWVDYISELQENVLDAYTGIIHGLRSENKLDAFKVHVNAVLDFVQRIMQQQQPPPAQAVVKGCVCVIGDLVLVFKTELTSFLANAAFMHRLAELAKGCDDPKVHQTAEWLKGLLTKYG
jgi:importin subunit beta-1